jgi:hypothetical protein
VPLGLSEQVSARSIALPDVAGRHESVALVNVFPTEAI